MKIILGSDDSGGFLFDSTAWARSRWADAMVAGLVELKLELRCMKHIQGFFLCDLDYERNSFCELTTVKMYHGKLATGRWLRRSSTAVGMASGDAPAPRTPPAAMV
jgi:hypothetical protein